MMLLTTELLNEKHDKYVLDIIEQTKNYRYVHITSDSNLQLIAFSFFPSFRIQQFIKVKQKIFNGEPIGQTIKREFHDYKKVLVDEGYLKIDNSLRKELKYKSRKCFYQFFEIRVQKRNKLFSKVLEIYSLPFLKQNIKRRHSDIHQIKKLSDSELLPFLDKFRITID